MQIVKVGNYEVGQGHPLMLMAGPCVLEGYERSLMIGQRTKAICDKLGIPYVFKASFDKANRSSYASFRGPGIEEGLKLLAQIKKDLGVPVVTDIHEPWQAEKAAEVVDILQIQESRDLQHIHVFGCPLCIGTLVNVGYHRYAETPAHLVQNLQRLFIADPGKTVDSRTVGLLVRPLEHVRDAQPIGYSADFFCDPQSHFFRFDHTRPGQEKETIALCVPDTRDVCQQFLCRHAFSVCFFHLRKIWASILFHHLTYIFPLSSSVSCDEERVFTLPAE